MLTKNGRCQLYEVHLCLKRQCLPRSFSFTANAHGCVGWSQTKYMSYMGLAIFYTVLDLKGSYWL